MSTASAADAAPASGRRAQPKGLLFNGNLLSRSSRGPTAEVELLFRALSSLAVVANTSRGFRHATRRARPAERAGNWPRVFFAHHQRLRFASGAAPRSARTARNHG